MTLATMDSRLLAERIDQMYAKIEAAKKREAELVQELAQTLAEDLPADQVRQALAAVRSDLEALPMAAQTLEREYRDRLDDEYSAVSKERLSRAEGVAAKLTGPASAAVKALNSLFDAVQEVRLQNPDLSPSDFGFGGTDSEAWAHAVAHGSERWKGLLVGIERAPAGVTALLVASAQAQARNKPRARTWGQSAR